METITKWVVGAFSLEGALVLAAYSGTIKTHPSFTFMPIDLTILSLLMVIVIILKRVMWGKNTYAFSIQNMSVILLFIFWIAVTILWSSGVIYAQKKLLSLIMIALPLCIVANIFVGRSPEAINRLLGAIILAAVILSLGNLGALLSRGQQVEMQLLGTDYIVINQVLGLGVVILSCSLLSEVHKKSNLFLYALLTTFFLMVMLMSGGKGPLLATMLTLLFCCTTQIYVRTDGVWISKRLFTLVCSIPVFAVALWIAIGQAPILFNTISRLDTLISVFISGGAGNDVRVKHLMTTINIISESSLWNLLFGHGMGSWPLFSNGYDTRAYPHNAILEIAVEYGLVGLVLYIVLIAVILRNVSKAISEKNIQYILIGLLIIYLLIGSMFSSDIVDTRGLYILIGIMFAVPYARLPGH